MRLDFVSTAGRCRLANASTRERLLVAGARVAHLVRQPLDGLEILREHVETRIDDRCDVGEVAGEVRRQRFDGRPRAARFDRADAVGVMPRAAVRQVVAIDRRQHDVAADP